MPFGEMSLVHNTKFTYNINIVSHMFSRPVEIANSTATTPHTYTKYVENEHIYTLTNAPQKSELVTWNNDRLRQLFDELFQLH